jgi:hypothetical protein
MEFEQIHSTQQEGRAEFSSADQKMHLYNFGLTFPKASYVARTVTQEIIFIRGKKSKCSESDVKCYDRATCTDPNKFQHI